MRELLEATISELEEAQEIIANLRFSNKFLCKQVDVMRDRWLLAESKLAHLKDKETYEVEKEAEVAALVKDDKERNGRSAQ